MLKDLVGEEVIIGANEFIDHDVIASISMIDKENGLMLLELDEPKVSETVMYRRAVASPRLSEEDICGLGMSGILGCSITWIPEDKYDPDNPMDLSWWRGGGAAIADLRMR